MKKILTLALTFLLLVSGCSKEKYLITFDTNGGNVIANMEVEEGFKIKDIENPIKEGYTFLYWTLDGEKLESNYSITKDANLKAVWQKNEEVKETLTVTFNVDGKKQTEEVAKGGLVAEPITPTKEGYIFKYWSLNGKEYNFTNKITSSIELKAVWEEVKKYTVTFNTTGGSSVKSQTVEENKTVTKPTNPTKEGYTFAGWTLNGKTYDFNSKVTKDITLIATWKAEVKKYTVTFNTDGGSSVKSQTIEENKTVTKPTNPTKAGYTFAGWTLDGKTYDFNSKVTKDITLKATWTKVEVPKVYTIKVELVDAYSPDRYLTVYEDGVAISVKKLMYTDNTEVIAAINGNKLSVANVDIVGETEFKVQLANGSIVTAKVN